MSTRFLIQPRSCDYSIETNLQVWSSNVHTGSQSPSTSCIGFVYGFFWVRAAQTPQTRLNSLGLFKLFPLRTAYIVKQCITLVEYAGGFHVFEDRGPTALSFGHWIPVPIFPAFVRCAIMCSFVLGRSLTSGLDWSNSVHLFINRVIFTVTCTSCALVRSLLGVSEFRCS